MKAGASTLWRISNQVHAGYARPFKDEEGMEIDSVSEIGTFRNFLNNFIEASALVSDPCLIHRFIRVWLHSVVDYRYTC